jgi:hypothetical protein
VTRFSPGKFTFHGRVLKSTACVAHLRNAVDETRIAIIFPNPRNKNTNELVSPPNRLTNNFANLVTSGLGPGMARGPQVRPRWSRLSSIE